MKRAIFTFTMLVGVAACNQRAIDQWPSAGVLDGSEEGDSVPLVAAGTVQAQVYALSLGRGPDDLGVELSWADGSPAAPQLVDDSLFITRSFETDADAQAFRNQFVARIRGVEIGREPAHLGLCSAVAELGFDPSQRKAVTVRREINFESQSPMWSTPIHYGPTLSCQLEPISVGRVVPVRRELRYWFMADKQPVTFALNGVPMEPADIAFHHDKIFYMLRLTYPYDKPLASIKDDVSVTLSGQTYRLTVGFENCSQEGKELAIETTSLRIADGKLQVDWSSWECLYTDGETGYGNAD